jgi:hypothetical protein
MRAVIGRARENRSSIELELMSSTSRDVGELWNGESIVRCMGTPNMVQLVFIRSEADDPITRGFYTLKTAIENGKLQYHSTSRGILIWCMYDILMMSSPHRL